MVVAGHVEADGRGSGGSSGELGACDSGGAGSGCDMAEPSSATSERRNAELTPSQPPVRAAAMVVAGHVEAGGRGSGGSSGELGACDSGGAGSGCDIADPSATSERRDAELTPSQGPPPMPWWQTADGAEPEAVAVTEAEDEELLSLRHELFAQLGEDVGEAACAAAAAAAAPTELRKPSKRARTAVQPYHASQAQRGGGGWSKYDLNRVGERHGRTRRKGRGYDELLASAQQLRGQMNDLAKLVCSPDRSFNAVMERVAAIVLHAAAREEAGSDATPEEAGSDAASVEDRNDACDHETAGTATTDSAAQQAL